MPVVITMLCESLLLGLIALLHFMLAGGDFRLGSVLLFMENYYVIYLNLLVGIHGYNVGHW